MQAMPSNLMRYTGKQLYKAWVAIAYFIVFMLSVGLLIFVYENAYPEKAAAIMARIDDRMYAEDVAEMKRLAAERKEERRLAAIEKQRELRREAAAARRQERLLAAAERKNERRLEAQHASLN